MAMHGVKYVLTYDFYVMFLIKYVQNDYSAGLLDHNRNCYRNPLKLLKENVKKFSDGILEQPVTRILGFYECL